MSSSNDTPPDIGSAGVMAPQSSKAPTPMSEYAPAWNGLLEGLDSLRPFRGAASLRHLGESAELVELLLELVATSTFALSALPEFRESLESLAEYEETLLELLELVELADRVEELSYLTRDVLSHRDELEWMIRDAEKNVVEGRSW